MLSGYLDFYSFASICEITPTIPHLVKMMVRLYYYDFTWIAYEDQYWKQQQTVPQSHAMAMFAALLHYRMHAPDLIRFLGGTYNGEYRDIDTAVSILQSFEVDPWLIAQYIRATTVGCPNKFVAETSRENFLLHWREGNHPSIKKFLVETMNTMTKEHRNRFNMPLPCYAARYLPHNFLTPQHALDKRDKALRLIFDATKRFTASSVPLNRMTSTPSGSEMDCLYGDTMLTLLERIWDLRISYPVVDIGLHANDVKSCFKQMKLHPDIMPAFSIMVTNFLYLQAALPFGTDFSPQNWEPVRRLVEILAVKLYDDDSLRDKHRKHLDKLNWEPSLGSGNKDLFVQAKACSQRRGVLDDQGTPLPTPQRLFVDDSVYAEIYQASHERMERAVAAGIEAIFILLGQSDLAKRQDPISLDKMTAMMVSYLNKILGQLIDTRRMDIGVPPDYIHRTLLLLKPFHKERKSFTVKEMETLTGMLVFIASTAPWLKFMMSHVYTSVAAAINKNYAHLIRTNKQFREFIKMAKDLEATSNERTFAQSATARQVHACTNKHWINKTLLQELHLITKALESALISKRAPIGHLIRRDPSATAWSDSCLYAAGGFSTDMRFWWYFEWPPEVRKFTLVYVRNNANGDLISINVLEYAAILINYAATTLYYETHHEPSDPYPLVLFNADNRASESWMVKSCTSSLIGRALARVQCAMMLNNRVGHYTGHVCTKTNVIADGISRIKRESNSMRGFLSLKQEFLELDGCMRFHPSAELISHILDAISQKKFVDPLAIRKTVQENPGHLTS